MGAPCAACKMRKQRCEEKVCLFAPYFPPEDPQKFYCVRKVYTAANFLKLLKEGPVGQRAKKARSLVFEVNARIKDPVNGCAGIVWSQQSKILDLRKQLAVVKAQIPCIQNHEAVKGGKGKEAFETASGVAAGEAAESSDAAVKRKRLLKRQGGKEAFVKGGKGKEAFETASGVAAGEAAESSDAAVKRKRFTFDLNELPSDEDEAIMP